MRYSVEREVCRSARTSICIPTYNGVRRVDWLLQSLKKVETPINDATITILDDGSPDRANLAEIAARHGANLIIHRQNEGVTKSWNDLARFVDAEFIVLLNDDLFLTRHWLTHLIFFLDNNECGTVSPDTWFCVEDDVRLLLTDQTVSPRTPTKIPLNQPAKMPDRPPMVCSAALGCAFAFRRGPYERVGGFDERTRMTHNESWLGTAMAQQLRLPSFILPAHIWHINGATFQENPQLSDRGDREAFIAHWGAYFEVTSPRAMRGMPPRKVRWLDADLRVRSQEFHMRWWD